MKCHSKILNIRWQGKIIKYQLRQDLGIIPVLSEQLTDGNLGLFGHICRMISNGLVNLAMHKRGRSARSWIDDIKVW
jgi:hypothetical protein